MPTYTAHCKVCDTHIDYIRKVDDRDNTPDHCGQKTERVFTACMIPQMGLADHYKIVRGSNVMYGRDDYLRYLKKNGLQPSSELKGEAEHQKAQIEKKAAETRRADVADIVRTNT